MRSIKYIPRFTYEEYKTWEGQWELIDGVPFAMTLLPSLNHQDINLNICFQLKQKLENCQSCKVFMPVDWRVNDDTVVQPDVSVICHQETSANNLNRAPVMIFELLSPSTALKDRNIKLKLYEEQGVKYYIIVDCNEKSAEIFEIINGNYQKVLETQNEKFLFNFTECQVDFEFKNVW
jgi:Uma2 family endonuclease